MTRTLAGFCLLALLAAAPTRARAFEFGFVRVPDYLDLPIMSAAGLTGVSLLLLLRSLPTRRRLAEDTEAERSPAMVLSAWMVMIALVATLGLLFLGMGLDRAAQW